MAGDGTENWRLIVEAARALTAAGQSPFTRVGVYEWIWRRHPRDQHDRPSLDPVFQGMVRNAPGGPSSAAGTPLVRVGRGEYVLAGDDAADRDGDAGSAPARRARAAASAGVVSLTEDEVKQGAREYLEAAGFGVTVAWGRERGTDSRQYRGLVARLPVLAWQWLHLTVLFVSRDEARQYSVRRITTPSQAELASPEPHNAVVAQPGNA